MSNNIDLTAYELDADGNRVTPASIWKFDPLYPALARAFGIDPNAPILVPDKPDEDDLTAGGKLCATIRSIPGKVDIDAFVDEDRIEVEFYLHHDNLFMIALMSDATYLRMKKEVPATILVGTSNIGAIMDIAGVSGEAFDREIIDWEWDEYGDEPEDRDFVVTLETLPFQKI